MQTDANGFFQFTNLPVGNFEVRDLPPQPIFQGTQTLDGATTAGTVNGVTRGVALVDVITDINLVGGENSINNDFGKVLPSNVRAYAAERNGLLRREQRQLIRRRRQPHRRRHGAICSRQMPRGRSGPKYADGDQ